MPRLVPPSGPLTAKIAFIGEAPGEEEEIAGQPFIGRSGIELTRLLSSAGIRRDEVYLDNVVPEKPASNDITKFIKIKKSGAVETTPEYDEYERQLLKRIQGLSANVLVPVGNVAVYALTGLSPALITKRHGSVLQGVTGHKVIPIIHPSTIVRGNYLNKWLITNDLKKIVREAEYPDIRLPEPHLIIAPSFAEAMEYLNYCETKKAIAFDIEGADYINCISFSADPNSAICIPFMAHSEHYYAPAEEYQLWMKIARILEHPTQHHIGQNVNYDASLLHYLYGIRVSNMEDTLIATKILYPDYPAKLEFIVWRHTAFNYYKDEGHLFIKEGRGRLEDFWHYSAMDSIVVLIAFQDQLKVLEQQGNYETYRYQRALLDAVQFAQARGIRVDQPGLAERDVEVSAEIDHWQEELEVMVGHELNVNSTPAMKKYFYGELKLKPITKKGKITLDERALRKLTAKGIMEARLVIRVRQLRTLRSNFLRMRLDPKDNRIRCAFNVGGTGSGRWSSSKFLFKYGRNLHNLPKKSAVGDPKPFRKFLLSDSGYVIFKFDLNMAENRIVAEIAPEPTMQAAFRNGLDLHHKTATGILSVLLGRPIRLVGDTVEAEQVAAYLTTLLCKEIDPADGKKAARDTLGKPNNHGGNYGMGAQKMAEQYGIPLNLCKLALQAYHRLYPGVHKMHEWITHQLYKDRTLTNCYGRKRIFRDRIEASDASGGVNAFYFIPQSSVADKINRDGVLTLYPASILQKPEIVTEYSELLYHAEFLLQVHDEVDFQLPLSLPTDQLFEIAQFIKINLERPMWWNGSPFVIPSDMEVGFNLAGVSETNPRGLRELKSKNFNLETFTTIINELRNLQECDLEQATA